MDGSDIIVNNSIKIRHMTLAHAKCPGNIKSKQDIGLMSVFDLTVIMYKTRQVIMSVFDLQKHNHKMRHKHIFFIILQTRSFRNNLHILTYLEKHQFRIIKARNTKIGGVMKKLVFLLLLKS